MSKSYLKRLVHQQTPKMVPRPTGCRPCDKAREELAKHGLLPKSLMEPKK